MYVRPNFSTKAELERAIQNGDKVTAYEPPVRGESVMQRALIDAGLAPSSSAGETPVPKDKVAVHLEGPHSKPHTWCATAEIKDGCVVRVWS